MDSCRPDILASGSDPYIHAVVLLSGVGPARKATFSLHHVACPRPALFGSALGVAALASQSQRTVRA